MIVHRNSFIARLLWKFPFLYYAPVRYGANTNDLIISQPLTSQDDAIDLNIRMTYHRDEVMLLREHYNPSDVRTWPYYPIVMPLKDGQGPASDAECDTITWEVWDRFCNSVSTFDNLPDAINDAMRRNKETLE